MNKQDNSRASVSLVSQVLVVLMFSCAAGCGGDGRLAVRGTVTLDGAPLKDGAINFQPVDTGAANTSGAGIDEGRFEIPAARGLKPGKYQVSVHAFKPSGRMVQDPEYGMVAEQVRVRFREAASLEATVAQGQDNEFDFALTSSN